MSNEKTRGMSASTCAVTGSFFFFFVFFLKLAIAKAAALEATTFSYNGLREAEAPVKCFQGASFDREGQRIQLTEGGAIQGMGRCLYAKAVQMRDAETGRARSFSTQFISQIQAGLNGLADGLAFVMAPAMAAADNSSQGLLGIVSKNAVSSTNNDNNMTNRTFAIEFDTYRNLEYDDADGNHVGVDFGSPVSLLASPAYFRLTNRSLSDASDGYEVQLEGLPTHVWIDYDGTRTQLNISVSHDVSPGAPKPAFPLISNSSVDLSSILHDYMYVGFSAATGPLPGVLYYLYSWSFSNNGTSADVSMTASAVPDNKKKTVFAIALVLGFATISAILGVIAASYLRRRRRRGRFLRDTNFQLGSFALDGCTLPREFAYNELSRATKGFHEKNKLGTGGFGSVYKGNLPLEGGKSEVAVKRISKDSKQGAKEFVSEVSTIGRLRHRNLVPLVGWCKEGGFMLVYELMSNGSLDKLLFQNQGGDERSEHLLSWGERLNILKGVARALLYLHEENEQKVVHRDVKASNVLLDRDMNAKLGDFGLARLYRHSVVPDSTNVAGTWGYMPPESFVLRKATDKWDVFSFGAVMMEVVTGRRICELMEEDKDNSLLLWLSRLHGDGALAEAIDPALRLSIEQEPLQSREIIQVLELGLLCCHPSPLNRPPMRLIVQILEGQAAPLPVSLSSFLDDNLHDVLSSSAMSSKSTVSSFDALLPESQARSNPRSFSCSHPNSASCTHEKQGR